ncbi:MAG: serine/threonine protein kinase [Planctomycetia bacterium]|nr:serine/threonine protein kinase [Planctomycetia bacterium]
MKPATAEELASRAEELQLLAPGDLHAVWAELEGRQASIEAFGSALLRHELLTSYQLERLLRGDRQGFFYGSAKILYQVGAGSFARVYRAKHVETGGTIAVKVLRSRYSADAEKCKAFRREGEMGRLLRHPNIVAIEDVGQQNNTSYITMEFVEGQTLRELVRIRGAVDVPRAVDLLAQMLSGLEYAHRRGLTHRDLKASNVIVSALGQAKIVDFGLAGVDAESGDKSLGKMEQPRTIDYATLENLAGMRNDSQRSDVFFLGTIAYLALAGKPALKETRDRAERSDPRRYTSIVSLHDVAPQVPRDVLDVVNRMLVLDPMERWQTAADVQRAVEPLVEKYRSGVAPASTKPGEASAPAVSTPARVAAKSGGRGTLMVVEVGEKPQEALRTLFTGLGYRVLMTENPERALGRFSATPAPADCLIVSAQALGEAALHAFNKLTTDPFFAPVPGVLLLHAGQRELAAQARVDERRKTLEAPVKGPEVAALIDSILKK